MIDLKVGKFTHAVAVQMNMSLNYAERRWTNNNKIPPVGLIHCAEKDIAVAKHALEALPEKVPTAEYRRALPNEKMLGKKRTQTRKLLEQRTIKRSIHAQHIDSLVHRAACLQNHDATHVCINESPFHIPSLL